MAELFRVLIVAEQQGIGESWTADLNRDGIMPEWQLARTEPEFVNALATPLDLILASGSLPRFDALRVLALVRERGLDMPVIVLFTENWNATSLPAAGAALRLGAADVLAGDQRGELAQAAARALESRQLRRANDAIRQGSAMFHGLFAHSTLGMSTTDLHGTYVLANHKFCEITGYSAEELTRLTFGEITHPDDREFDESRYHDLLSGDIPAYVLMKRYVRKDGSVVWVRVNTSLLLDDAGVPAYRFAIVGIMNDQQNADTKEQQMADQQRGQASLLESETAERRRTDEALHAQRELQGSASKAMLSREMRVIELKEEINRLCAELGRPPVYPGLG